MGASQATTAVRSSAARFALGPNMANFVAHLVFPFIYGGYVPGLWTAPLHGAMSLWLLRTLVLQHRETVRAARQNGH